ncbi:Nuclear protein localization protein 4 -like protein [Babesia sp. Xinjiang]|uniref:Nuclear protein localization protein 4 -like protein n=1 Tax=Babesia sp. Xinjiang TaxID=462227 RepID=UPI000A214FC7|nr:Nuclear protein localization protein 4 -like protein [Babesia sp. Xinjiang]ORM41761.1 Nuclear protein localization protein 4 -like protein [Babesia sp. Xinjiang]
MLIIRVLSNIGISRIAFDDGATLGDLKEEIRKRIQIPEGVTLKFVVGDSNDEICGSDVDPLTSVGVEHGSCLRLIIVQSDPDKIQDLSYVSMCKPDPDQVESEPSPAGSMPTTSRGSADEPQNTGSQPNFKSFDAYLRDNGYPVSDLALKQSYKPVLIERGKMNKLPSGVTVKHQPYRHVDHIELMNVKDIHSFANYWMIDLEMAEQRAGWLYGYYVEDPHYPLGIRAVCEGIYEPPQKSSLCEVEFLQDDFLPVVDLIADRFGLERIGHIITHLPRENYLSPQDVIDSAKVQLERVYDTHYTGYPVSTHVTCTLHPDSEGKPALNAFMVSDTAMALLRDGIISEVQSDPMFLRIREPKQKNEILPQIIESGKEVTKFDPSWFVIRVNDSAPITPNSIFKYAEFPRENRCTQPVTTDAVKSFLSSRLAEGFESSDPKIFSDFHLLLYLAKILDVDTALAICDAVIGKAPLDPIMVELLMAN